MNNEYEDPFAPLPSLPGVSASQFNIERTRQRDSEEKNIFPNRLGNEPHENGEKLDIKIDSSFLGEDYMMFSEDDCSDESDIEDDDFDMTKAMFEPINIFIVISSMFPFLFAS